MNDKSRSYNTYHYKIYQISLYSSSYYRCLPFMTVFLSDSSSRSILTKTSATFAFCLVFDRLDLLLYSLLLKLLIVCLLLAGNFLSRFLWLLLNFGFFISTSKLSNSLIFGISLYYSRSYFYSILSKYCPYRLWTRSWGPSLASST